MKKVILNNSTVTIGITTCYGDESILDTVYSIRNSFGVSKCRFIIIADKNPIKNSIKNKLKLANVELIENKVESSQTAKRKQILQLCTTDIILFTQDDVLFDPTAISLILKQFFLHPKTTFISIKNEAVRGKTFFEEVINTGTSITNRVAQSWRNGDNYLSVVGRSMAFRTKFIKNKFRLPDGVVSSDAYHYFENKRQQGVYEFVPQAKLFFRNPQNFKEYLRKSNRFQFSFFEMSQYFKDLKEEYQIPRVILLRALFSEFVHNPIHMLLYLAVYMYSRFQKKNPKTILNPIWEVDASTKKVVI